MLFRKQSQELSVAKHERTFIKLSFALLAGLVVFIALCWVGRKAYVRWQEKRMVVRAAVAFQKGDYRAAALAAQTVLQFKPKSVPATRILAQVGERVGDRAGAIQGRRKVAELEPKSVDDALDWAMTAQSFNDSAETQRALDHLPAAGKETARYHAIVAVLDHQTGRLDDEMKEWKEALRLDPTEKRYQLQLALLQLQSPNESEHAEAVATLTRLRDYPGQRSAATRALISEGATHKESAATLLKLAQELKDYPEATLSDRLLYLTFLHQLNDPQYLTFLEEMERSCRGNATDAADLLGWLGRNNQRFQALDFAKTIPPEILRQWPVPGALADLQLRLRDWKKLEEMVKDANWREFEFFRHAYLARALRETDKPAPAAHEWAAAAKDAGEHAEKAFALFKLADEWHWFPEAIDLLWDLTKYPERKREALTGLYRSYAIQGDTQGLYRVTLRLVESYPDNTDFRNNLAQIGLLLEAQIHDAQRLAAETYQKQPTNPAYATTFAYALLTEGKKEKAVEVLRKLTPEQLEDPPTAVYYGICLAAAGDPEAKKYLELAQKAPLLPQEKALLEKATNSIR